MTPTYVPIAFAVKIAFPTLADRRFSAAGVVYCPACVRIRNGSVGYAPELNGKKCETCAGERKIVALELRNDVIGAYRKDFRLSILDAAARAYFAHAFPGESLPPAEALANAVAPPSDPAPIDSQGGGTAAPGAGTEAPASSSLDR